MVWCVVWCRVGWGGGPLPAIRHPEAKRGVVQDVAAEVAVDEIGCRDLPPWRNSGSAAFRGGGGLLAVAFDRAGDGFQKLLYAWEEGNGRSQDGERKERWIVGKFERTDGKDRRGEVE